MISILTATVPERKDFLVKAIESVQAQTFKDFEHIVFEDVNKVGNWFSYNQLVERAKGQYITFLDDDDYLLPNHLGELFKYKDKADVIYNAGIIDDPRKDKKYIWYNDNFDYINFQKYNYIPITAMIKTDVAKKIMFESRQDCDYVFWKKAICDLGLTLYQNKVETWVYNFHGGNFSFQS